MDSPPPVKAASGPGALAQLGALRERLAQADPVFAAGARVEQDAKAFCQQIRDDLKAHRLAANLTQADLARQLDLTQSAISKLESGRGELSLKMLFRIADAIGVHPLMVFVYASHSQSAEAVEAPVAAAAEALSARAAEISAALVGAVQEDIIRQIPEIVQSTMARMTTAD